MQRVVAFYEALPRGPAPAPQPKGLLQRYQHRYMNGKNARAMRMSLDPKAKDRKKEDQGY